MVNFTAVAVLLAYGLILAGVGLWAGRRVRHAEDFYVAGRRLGPGLLAATVLAANIGSGTTVGVAGLAYAVGSGAAWWTGSAVIGTVVLALTLGPRMWRLARELDCYTVGDYLEVRFGVRLRSTAMGFLWAAGVFILMAQIVAIGRVVNAFSGLALEYGIVVGGLVVLAYFAAGGLWSSAVVNVVQLGVKLVAFPLAFVAAIFVLGENLDEFALAAGALPEGFNSTMGIGPLGIAGFLTVLGTAFVISPGLLQKGFGARDEQTVRRGFLWAAAGLGTFGFVPVALGMLARVAWPVPPPGFTLDQTGWVLPQMLVEVLPPAVGLLALAAVVSAELSSADAVLFMLSTSMSRDFYQRFWNPGVDDAGLLRAGRRAAIVGLVASVAIALVFPSILGGLSLFYTVMTIVLAVPLVAGVYWPRADETAALASVGAGVAAWLVALAITGEMPGPSNMWPSLVGLVAAAAVGVAVTLRPTAGR